MLGLISAWSHSVFSPVPAPIRDDGFFDSHCNLPAVEDRHLLGHIAPPKLVTPGVAIMLTGSDLVEGPAAVVAGPWFELYPQGDYDRRIHPSLGCTVRGKLNLWVVNIGAEHAGHHLPGAFDGVHSAQVFLPLLAGQRACEDRQRWHTSTDREGCSLAPLLWSSAHFP